MRFRRQALLRYGKWFFAGKGFFNGVLHLFDLSGVDWMNTGDAFWVLVFSYVWKNLGYSIVLWMAGLMTIPQGIYEAQIDGAGERTILFRITLPMIRPVIFTIVILSFLNSFKVFREAYLWWREIIHRRIFTCCSICLITGLWICRWTRWRQCRNPCGSRRSIDDAVTEKLGKVLRFKVCRLRRNERMKK